MQTYIMKKEDEIVNLRNELKDAISNQQIQQVQVDNSRITDLESQLKALSEDNESLVAQRKTLAKTKDSLAKEFERFIRDYDAQKVDFQQNIERLSAANARVTQQMEEGELDREALRREKGTLEEEVGLCRQRVKEA